mgnify:CR=1 FL=1
MPRPRLQRRVGQPPRATYFKPAGVPLRELEEVVLSLDELEAIRLTDLEGLYQEAASAQMQISRPTLSRVLASARHKVAAALVNGRALRLEGGPVLQVAEDPSPGARRPGPGAGRKRRQCRAVLQKGQTTMKIAITAASWDIEGSVDQQLGRAVAFILYDTETGDWSTHDNTLPGRSAQGAGVRSAQMVVDLEADAVITGHCGPKAFRALEAAGIPIYTGAQGSVREAIKAFEAGELKPLDGPNAAPHSGTPGTK